MNIVEETTVTPEHPATTVVFEDATRWNVECEAAGCGNVVTVAKRTYVPVDWRNRPDDVRKVELTGPEARRCALHGPELSR